MKHCRISRFLTFMLVAGSAVGAASAADDSIWINQNIQNAIQQGKSEYVLPAGTYTLQNSILIPPGTKNFTLRGEGKDSTIITSPNQKLAQGIAAGVVTMLHNNWGLTNRTNTLVDNVLAGSRAVRLSAGQADIAPGYYVLWDQNIVLRISGDNGAMNHAEVVKVLSYDKSTRTAYLDNPTGREFNVNPRLCHVNDSILTNVTISDMGFDGAVLDGTCSTSFLAAGISDGLHVARLKVRNYTTNAIYTNIARNALVEQTDVSGANAFGPGGGYGVGIYRSRFVTVQDCMDDQSRHGFIVHSGSQDVLFQNCVSYLGGFDCHGYDDRRITFRSCVGTVLNVGNGAYLAGSKDVMADSCIFTEMLSINENTRNTYLRNCSMKGLIFYYTAEGSTLGTPSGGYADGVTVQGCTIKGELGNGILTNASKIGNVSFNKCKFECPTSGNVFTIRFQTMNQANMQFNSCEFLSSSLTYFVQMKSAGSPNLKLYFQNCKFKNTAAFNKVFEVGQTFTGRVYINKCVFESVGGQNLSMVSDTFNRLGSTAKNATNKCIAL